jgi:hypothetical protein
MIHPTWFMVTEAEKYMRFYWAAGHQFENQFRKSQFVTKLKF